MSETRSGRAFSFLSVALLLALLAACTPGSVPREVKIALIAPFEGKGRPFGYRVLSGVKLALQETGHRLPGGEIVSLVALNDDGDPRKAARQVRTASADPAVLAIIGPWSRATASAASDALRSGDPPMVVPASLPDDKLSPGRYRLFADDRSLAEATGREARTVGGCGTVVVDGTDSLLEGNRCPEGGIPHWIMVCCDPGKTAAAASGWQRDHPSVALPILIAGPDAFRPWILGALPRGAEVHWVTSWDEPDADFSERFRERTGQEASVEAYAAYRATKQVLDAMARASSGGISRSGVGEEIERGLEGKGYAVHVIVIRAGE